MGAKIERRSHIFEREEADHYRPGFRRACSSSRASPALLKSTQPAVRILESAKAAGYATLSRPRPWANFPSDFDYLATMMER
jgi:hypothetical protein